MTAQFHTFAFTGHRPDKLGGYSRTSNETYQFVRTWLEFQIKSLVKRYKYVDFISGGALGVDQIVAEIVLDERTRIRTDGSLIRLTLALPCRDHGNKWPLAAQNEWKAIIARADNVTYVHDGLYPGPHCLQKRNEWMVDHCEGLIAVFNSTEEKSKNSGTRNCMLYAWKKGVPILRLDPVKHAEERIRKDVNLTSIGSERR